MRRLGVGALLVTLWVLAWGEVTVANLVSGAVVTGALLIAFPQHRRGAGARRLDLGGSIRLAAFVALQVVAANIEMTRRILRRRVDHRPAVLAHRFRQPSEEVLTVMSSIIALSPGTMTIDVDEDSSVIYVHFFDVHDADAARAALDRLEQRVIDAVPPRPGTSSVDKEPS
jgi:multicomponent Na+:H+ antiporter subunit E